MNRYCDGCNQQLDESGVLLQRSRDYADCMPIALCAKCAETLFLAIKAKRADDDKLQEQADLARQDWLEQRGRG